MTKSTRSRPVRKPRKPRPDFPLFSHQNGRWAKKVKGKLCYFGKWSDDPDGEQALKLWIEQKDQLLAGVPQPLVTRNENGMGLPLHELVNDFLNAKRRRLDSDRLSPRTFGEYTATGKRLTEAFGRDRAVATLTPDDFGRLYDQLAKTRGLVALGNEITRVRMVFKWGFENGKLENAIRFGSEFVKPSKDEIQKQRALNGHDDADKTFTVDELKAILAKIYRNPALKAMILLALNAAYGASDLARLLMKQIDLESGWAKSARPKTGEPRGAKLWPETVEAIKTYLEVRPEAADSKHADLLFLTQKGKPWVRQSDGVKDDGEIDPRRWAFRTDLIGKGFAKVLRKLEMNGRRGVYALRHTAATVADEAVPDRQAVKYLLGHSGGTITDGYVHRPPSDERMEAVAGAVHDWLFGAEGGTA